MGPVIRRYYYDASSIKVDKQLGLSLKDGSVEEGAKDLYLDEALTKIVGTKYYKVIKLGNKLGVPILQIEATVTTVEGSFTYSYIRDDYREKIFNTEVTSGLFTGGTVTRKYKADKLFHRVRELTYTSNK